MSQAPPSCCILPLPDASELHCAFTRRTAPRRFIYISASRRPRRLNALCLLRISTVPNISAAHSTGFTFLFDFRTSREQGFIHRALQRRSAPPSDVPPATYRTHGRSLSLTLLCSSQAELTILYSAFTVSRHLPLNAAFAYLLLFLGEQRCELLTFFPRILVLNNCILTRCQRVPLLADFVLHLGFPQRTHDSLRSLPNILRRLRERQDNSNSNDWLL
ncbi:hypothetical protein C8J57DRAFT_248187 [Mycena rebaudengoi]|nr:hypothetical protein C8J57DRAFT_248187 [Mycena rebaudengoi]